MLNYTPLSSEKYLLQAMNQEYKKLRRQQVRETFQSITTFIVAAATISLVIYAYYNMPAWIEAIDKTTNWQFPSLNGFPK